MAKKAKPVALYLGRNEVTGEVINAWLKTYDPDFGDDGRGFFECVENRDEAKVFQSLEEAHAYWTQVPKVMPTRPDGKPNRPLTAFTVEVRPIERETGEPWGGKNRLKGEGR